MSVAVEGFVGPARRKVAIRRDQQDYVIVLQPEDLVLFRNPNANALRKACIFFAGRLSATPFQKRMTRPLGNIERCRRCRHGSSWPTLKTR